MGLFSIFKKNVLYYPGCYVEYGLKKEFELYKKILKKLGIKYGVLGGVGCCGGIAYELGYDKEARKLARRNFEKFQEEKIRKIITNCPLCYRTFSKQYGDMLPDWDIETEHIIPIILEKLQDNLDLIKNYSNEIVLYLDSCYIGRHSGIYEEPREILKLIGYHVLEMPDNRENAMCCGSCGGLSLTNTKFASKIALRLLSQIQKMKIKKIIVADPIAFEHLRENSKDLNINIIEFSEILADALGIKYEKEE